MDKGWLGAMVVLHTRTDSFSNWGVRSVDLAGCALAAPVKPSASMTRQDAFRMVIGPPSRTMGKRLRDL